MTKRVGRSKLATKIAALLGGGATYQHIANVTRVSTKTVQRIAKQIRPDLEEATEQLMEYQRLIRVRMPISSRVEVYQAIVEKKDTNPFASLKALGRLDDLDGITTEKDRLRQHDQGSQQPPRPMFMFAPGSGADINVTIAPAGPEAALSLRRQEMDVTPNGNGQEPKAPSQLPESSKRST